MAQDAFERALSQLTTFNGRSSFGTWVQRIAVNRTIDQLRGDRRLGDLPDDIEDPAEWADRPHADPAVMRAVAKLAPDRRIPVVLRHGATHSPLLGETLGRPGPDGAVGRACA